MWISFSFFSSLYKVHNLFQSLEFFLQGLDSQGIIRDDVRDDESGKFQSQSRGWCTLHEKTENDLFISAEPLAEVLKILLHGLCL